MTPTDRWPDPWNSFNTGTLVVDVTSWRTARREDLS